MRTLSIGFIVLASAASAATTASAQVRVIASNPQGSIFYSASATIGKLLDEKLKMQVRVQPMGGSSNYIPLLNRGEVDFGLTNVDDARTAFKGALPFKQANPDLRLMASVFPLKLSALVVGNSPIKTVADLKGKLLPSGYNAQTTGRVLQDAMLATAGLTMKDVVGVPTQSLFSGVDLLGEGKVDAATIVPGTGQGQRANVSLAAKGGVRFLNIPNTPQNLAAIRKHLPARLSVVQPAPHAVGVIGPTTMITYAIFFSTHAKMPDDVVYDIAKTLHANKPALQGGTPIFSDFEPKGMTQEIGVPWHPGAIKFYKETGQWPPGD